MSEPVYVGIDVARAHRLAFALGISIKDESEAE